MNHKNLLYTHCRIVFFLYLFTSLTCAQHYQFKTLQQEDGLASSYVHEAAEDADGYMWIATLRGISRYDGKEMITYGPESGFIDAGAYKVFKDKLGQLWFISLNYHLYRLEKGKLKRILPYSRIVWMGEDEHSLYLIGREGDFINITYKGEIIDSQKLINSVLYFGIRIARNKFIFVTSNDVFLKKDTALIRLKTYKYIYAITRVFKLPDGRILLCNIDGIYQYISEKEPLRMIFPMHHTEIYSIYSDPATKDLWLSTSNGAYRFKKGILDDQHLEKLFHEIITSIHKTPTEEMYFTSFGEGVHIGSLHTSYYTKEDGLKTNEIACIRQTEDYIYVFSRNGLLHYLKQKKLYNLSSRFEDAYLFFYQADAHKPLYYSGRDTIWTIKNNRVLPAERYLRTYNHITIPVLRYIDPKGTKYFGTPPTTLYDPLKKKYFSILNREENAYLLSVLKDPYLSRENIFNAPVPINGKDLYIFLDRGLLRIHAQSGNLFHIYDTVYASRPTDMIYTSNQHFVIATRNKGLDILVDNQHHFYTTENGLPSNTFYKLVYEKGTLWACTGAGLVALQLDNRDSITHITTYRPGNYQTQEEVNDMLIDGDDIYIASNKGLSLFNKKTLRPALNGLPLYFQRIRINERDTSIQDSFVLPHRFNNIEINYRAVLFSNEKIQYKYKLEGADNPWQYTERENITYAALKPGTYHFVVYAKTENGGWGNSPQILHFIIQPPFWKTWWFIALEILFFLATVAFISFRIIQLNKKRNETRRKIIESELRAIRLHMNPHFIYNTLSSLQSFILDNQSEKANLYLSKFSRLIRLIMHYSSKKEIVLSEEIDFLNRYIELEQMRFYNKFDFKIHITENVDKESTYLPPLIIQPFIENAIKYGVNNKAGHGTILLDISIQDKLLLCVVEDDGIGRKRSQELKMGYKDIFESTGIKYTADRLRLLSAQVPNPDPVRIIDLYTTDGVASGTRVEIFIPLT